MLKSNTNNAPGLYSDVFIHSGILSKYARAPQSTIICYKQSTHNWPQNIQYIVYAAKILEMSIIFHF